MLSNETTKPGLELKSYPETFCVDENVDEAAELLLERSSAASVQRKTAAADGNQFKPPVREHPTAPGVSYQVGSERRPSPGCG